MPLDPSIQVHPLASCESDQIGARTRIWAFAHVMDGAVVGEDCNVCDHVFVENGAVIGDRVTIKNNVMVWEKVTIEDEVFLGPNTVLTNDRNPRAARPPGERLLLPTRIRHGATTGANSTILCGLTIGRWAFVGAGAVVTRDVPDHVLVYGNPARPQGFSCRCGQTLPDYLVCEACDLAFDRRGDGGLEKHVIDESEVPGIRPAGRSTTSP